MAVTGCLCFLLFLTLYSIVYSLPELNLFSSTLPISTPLSTWTTTTVYHQIQNYYYYYLTLQKRSLSHIVNYIQPCEFPCVCLSTFSKQHRHCSRRWMAWRNEGQYNRVTTSSSFPSSSLDQPTHPPPSRLAGVVSPSVSQDYDLFPKIYVCLFLWLQLDCIPNTPTQHHSSVLHSQCLARPMRKQPEASSITTLCSTLQQHHYHHHPTLPSAVTVCTGSPSISSNYRNYSSIQKNRFILRRRLRDDKNSILHSPRNSSYSSPTWAATIHPHSFTINFRIDVVASLSLSPSLSLSRQRHKPRRPHPLRLLHHL